MKLAILGFAREGKSVLKFLKSSPAYKDGEISILDQKLDKNYLKNLNKFDIVFRSPGVSYNLPQIQRAIKKGTRFSSATKLFFENSPTKNLIGITGTKGKGTTATLLYGILKSCGVEVVLAGNIGKSALEILPKLKNDTWVILELSSFQLQDLEQSPKIAVVLDIFPDHLDSHKNFREYIEAKANIAHFQAKQDKIFYFSDNKNSDWIAHQSHAQKITLEASTVNLPPLKIPGTHNRKNAAMAKTVALALGCPEHAIDKIVAGYQGMEHRLEFVRAIKVYSNVLKNIRINFYNDSASTNPQTAAAAVLSFAKNPSTHKPINSQTILIAGGRDKNLNYAPLAQAIKKSGNVKAVVLFGENKKKIQKALANSKRGLGITLTKDLKSAIKTAYQNAKKLINSSTHQLIPVVFSPGSTSFDMFRDYRDRGKQFKSLVRKLKAARLLRPLE